MNRIISGYYFAEQLSVITYNIEYFKKHDSEKAISPNYLRKEFNVEPQTVLFLPYTDSIGACSNHSQGKLLLEIRNTATQNLLYRKIYRYGT